MPTAAALGLAFALALLPGCGDNNGTAGGDLVMSVAEDLSNFFNDDLSPPDLRPPVDLACFGGPDGACGTCLAAHCNTEASTCFGASWPTMNDPAAQCGSFYTCQCACKATQQDGSSSGDCLGQCAAAGGATCQSCINNVFACIQTNCPACM